MDCHGRLGSLACSQGGSHITQLGVVLRMLFDPEAGNGFYRFQRLLGQGLVIDRTEKLTDIGLGGRKHDVNYCR
jgi:hypothetical protein